MKLWTGLWHLNVFLSQRWAHFTTNQSYINPSRKKVPWQTPQQRWMEDFIFHLSLSDFSQLSNYLSEFHTVYWTTADLQIFHLSFLSSSRLVGLLCFIKFSLTFSATWFWLVPACMKEPMLSPTALRGEIIFGILSFLVWKSAFEQEPNHWKHQTWP